METTVGDHDYFKARRNKTPLLKGQYSSMKCLFAYSAPSCFDRMYSYLYIFCFVFGPLLTKVSHHLVRGGQPIVFSESDIRNSPLDWGLGPISDSPIVSWIRQYDIQYSDSSIVSRTHGVSIFIDYCTALAIQRKVEGKERDAGLINRTRSAAVQPGATWCLMACARRGVLIRAPPPSHTPPTGL
jgi:hypothetical protein